MGIEPLHLERLSAEAELYPTSRGSAFMSFSYLYSVVSVPTELGGDEVPGVSLTFSCTYDTIVWYLIRGFQIVCPGLTIPGPHVLTSRSAIGGKPRSTLSIEKCRKFFFECTIVQYSGYNTKQWTGEETSHLNESLSQQVYRMSILVLIQKWRNRRILKNPRHHTGCQVPPL